MAFNILLVYILSLSDLISSVLAQTLPYIGKCNTRVLIYSDFTFLEMILLTTVYFCELFGCILCLGSHFGQTEVS